MRSSSPELWANGRGIPPARRRKVAIEGHLFLPAKREKLRRKKFEKNWKFGNMIHNFIQEGIT